MRDSATGNGATKDMRDGAIGYGATGLSREWGKNNHEKCN